MALTVIDADNLGWTVQVQWRPRFLGLARRIGGWRDKRRNPDQGGDVLDLLDVPYPGWSFDHAPNFNTSGGARASGGGSGSGGGWFDFDDLDEIAVIILAALLALIALIAAAVLFWWVLLPVLLVMLDGILVAVLLVLGTVARLAFRRPWTVQAISARGDRLTKKVVGWRNARNARDDIASQIRNGSIRTSRPKDPEERQSA